MENSAEYEAEMTTTFAARTFEQWCEVLRPSLGPWAPVQSADEVVRDPQVTANDYLPEKTSPDGDLYRLAAIPAEFDETPTPVSSAPGTGEHTDEILQELGYGWEEIIKLKIADVIA